MNYKNLLVSTALTATLFAAPHFALADQYGTSQYGSPNYGGNGGPSVFLSINKVVLNPSTGKYVDNLSVNDPKYAPNTTASFQLTVTNTSDQDVSSIVVKDIFPDYLTFVSGPGNFDKNTKTLSLGVDSLKAQESKTFTIKAQTSNVDGLPKDQGVTCTINKAQVLSNMTKGGESTVQSEDNSQLCIEKQILGKTIFPSPKSKTTPSTGPEALALIPLLGGLVSGFALRRKTNNI